MEMRNKFFDLINKKDQEYEKIFKNMTTLEKKRLIFILNDDYLSFIHDELVMKRNILMKDEFLNFIRRKYTQKLTFLNCIQTIQMSSNILILLLGSDELLLVTNPIRNRFDGKIKKMFLLANDDLHLIYENIKNTRNEENFWKEFMKNQKNNQTEFFGGIRPLFFTAEEERIKKDKSDINLQGTNTQSMIFSKPSKILKKYEMLEKHRNFAPKFLGTCFSSVSEYDYKDRDMSSEENFNKKEISNLIENLNNYSMRKLENTPYIPRTSFFSKYREKSCIRQENIKPVTSLTKDGISNNFSTIAKFEEMRKKYHEQNKTEIIKKESIEVFKQVSFLII
jgi:hypothetical protein